MDASDPRWTYFYEKRKVIAPTEWKTPSDAPKEWYCLLELDQDELYYEMVSKSEGFNSFSDGYSEICGDIRPCTISKHVIEATDFAINEYNRKGGNLKLKEIIKANAQFISGLVFYITLEATNGEEDNFYEVKVYVEMQGMTLDIFRRAMYYEV